MGRNGFMQRAALASAVMDSFYDIENVTDTPHSVRQKPGIGSKLAELRDKKRQIENLLIPHTEKVTRQQARRAAIILKKLKGNANG